MVLHACTLATNAILEGNPLPPAACGARAITGYRCIDCLFGALAEVVPERVTADSTGGSTLLTLAG